MAVAKSYENWEIIGDVFTDEAGSVCSILVRVVAALAIILSI